MMDLDARLLQAHTDGDIPGLVALYYEAAQTTTDATKSGFFLTHAYVFALEAGLPEAADLLQRLIELGSEPQVD